MSNTIRTRTHETPYTRSYDEVSVENRNAYNNRVKIKQFQNKQQFDHVIHDLVVNKGYVMDSKKGSIIKFTHPTLNSEYTLDTENLVGKYHDKDLLGRVV